MRIRYYTDTTIQIFKTYTETHICCYIGIISRILTDSYRVNKREYGLRVFIESLYSDIWESYSINIQEIFFLYSIVFCSNTGEYGAKKPLFLVVLCSDSLLLFPHSYFFSLTSKSNLNLENDRMSELHKKRLS